MLTIPPTWRLQMGVQKVRGNRLGQDQQDQTRRAGRESCAVVEDRIVPLLT